ncbi:DNA polymerase III subunit beta [Bacillus sp. SCS-153A]|uniref:DNA polymerase III subunit beta n=1 Tax=Rossellomorea sedimentorum TaxID=3115294 RepID=UPI003905BAEE
MEFQIDSQKLKKALNIVARVIPGTSAIPVLTGVKVEANDLQQLVLTGGDSDVSMAKAIDLDQGDAGKVIEPGEFVIPVKHFHNLIKKMPDDSAVNIRKMNNQIKITSGLIETTLSLLKEENYPAMPDVPDNNGVRIKGSLMIDMIKQTHYAVSTSDSRAILTGVNWVFSANQLTMIGTNSQRMAVRKADLQASVSGSFILPGKAMNELINAVDKHEFINIYPSDNLVIFQGEDLHLYTRLISGNYPDISKIIPEETATEVVVSRPKLLQGIERAILLASEWKHNNVSFSLTNEGSIKLTSSTSEIGQITERLIPLEVRGEKTLNVSFDGKFLAEALKSITEELVSLSFGGSLRPIIIRPYNKQSSFHLISPVRTS